MLTGNDLINEAALTLGETKQTQAQLQGQLWPRHVRRACNYIAEKTKFLYGSITQDLIANQYEYVFDSIPFEIRATSIINDQGNGPYPIDSCRPEDMDRNYVSWRDPQTWATGVPRIVVIEGTNRYKLWPVPNYNMEFGIQIEGYLNVGDWWSMTDPPPMNQWGETLEETIVAGACWRRCREMASQPDYANKLKMFKDDEQDGLRRLCIMAMNHSPATRVGGPSPASTGTLLGQYGGSSYWGY